MTKEYKMFKDLSRKEQLELVEAALDGKDIEMTSGGMIMTRILVLTCLKASRKGTSVMMLL